MTTEARISSALALAYDEVARLHQEMADESNWSTWAANRHRALAAKASDTAMSYRRHMAYLNGDAQAQAQTQEQPA